MIIVPMTVALLASVKTIVEPLLLSSATALHVNILRLPVMTVVFKPISQVMSDQLESLLSVEEADPPYLNHVLDHEFFGAGCWRTMSRMRGF